MRNSLVRPSYTVSFHPCTSIDLIVVLSGKSLISKKINWFILLQKLKTVSFVPTLWENVKTYLPSYRVSQIVTLKLFLQFFNQPFPYSVLFVVNLEVVSFRLRTVSPYGTDVDHSIAIFYESAPFDWNLNFAELSESEVEKLLQLFFAHKLAETLFVDNLFLLKSVKSIFREDIFHKIGDLFSYLV